LILSAIVRGLEKLHAKFNGALQMTLNRRAGDPARGAPRFIRDRQLRGAEFKAAYVADGSIARRGDRSWLAAKLSSLAPQLHNQDSRGDIAGITPHVVAGAPFDRTGMRG
jgi:hypothetical protein